MSTWPNDITLSGSYATLEPLDHAHGSDLAQASAEGELYSLWVTTIPAPEEVPNEIARRLTLRQAGSMLPFAVLNSKGRAIGMTTYMNIDAANKRVEIGSTWYAKSAQRTGINTECKFMLLRHAFEDLGCIAVEFRTHRLNTASRRAIERLGAQLDGILRAHMVLPNGTIRDTACYSITAQEWPTIRANLGHKLSSYT